jgi:uncharacterized coiled-coil protein SlyX
MSASNLQERIESLEMLTAFQDRTIAQLNEAVLGLATRVEALGRQLESLKTQGTDADVGPHADPPPHY